MAQWHQIRTVLAAEVALGAVSHPTALAVWNSGDAWRHRLLAVEPALPVASELSGLWDVADQLSELLDEVAQGGLDVLATEAAPGGWCTATSRPPRRLAQRSRRGPRWRSLLAWNRMFRALISCGTEIAGRGTTTGATPFGTRHLDQRRYSLRAAEADQRAREADVQRLTPELEAAQALDARRADAQEQRERSAEGLAALVDAERALAAATGGAERAVVDGAGGAR